MLVNNGPANGTRVPLLSVTLKAGEETLELKLECGTQVRAMYASQVMSLTVKHEAEDMHKYLMWHQKKCYSKQHLRLVLSNISLECREHNFPVLAMDAQRDTTYREVVVQKCW